MDEWSEHSKRIAASARKAVGDLIAQNKIDDQSIRDSEQFNGNSYELTQTDGGSDND